MKNKILKIIAIFFLFISMFRTGTISTFLNDINLYLFGGTYFWIIIMVILFIMVSFLNEKKKNYFRKYLIAITLVGISVDLIYTLIKIKLNSNLDYEFFVKQTIFASDNIGDKIGFIQSFFEVSVDTLFGNMGIYIIAFILFGVGIFLILDIDSFLMFIGHTIKKVFNNIFSDNEDDEDIDDNKSDSTLILNKYKEKATDKSSSKKKKEKKQVEQQPSQRNKFEDVTLDSTKRNKSKKLSVYKGKKSNKKEENFAFEPPKNIGNKEIIGTDNYGDNSKSLGLKKENNLNSAFVVQPVTKTPKEKVVPKEDVLSNSKATKVVGLKDNKKYKIPPVTLLLDIEDNKENYKKLKISAKNKARLLLDSLESFKVKAQLRNIIVGSSITRYEIQPEPGQKVSKFSSLNNDLAMALSAKSIRIEAPIPGKPLVGIEVPNEKRLMVGLREVIKSNIHDSKGKLKIALGKDIEGQTQTLDIAKAPHLLVAGATGSGKSVCINGIIVNILLKATPEEVKFLLIDPKKVELTPYDGIPHLLSPVITDPEKAAVALNKLVYEMEKRYDLFAQTKTRNIESYNRLKDVENIPYIVAIIDELADLMMVSSTEVEVAISRIAQKARAAGIHLILATQRPSTDVITGLIKSNIPTRISFSVSSSIDSRTILDKTGAEKLLGNGDMLLSTNESPNPIRIQGAYLSDEEIQKVVEYINSQFDQNNIDDYYEKDFLKLDVQKKEEVENEDSLLLEAISLGFENNKISTSMLQRRLRIGFNRATTIIEQLENKGWVSKSLGSNKGREILVTKYEVFGNTNDDEQLKQRDYKEDEL